jgi:phosphoribosylglycinamide formyltransferase-1
MLRVGVLVSGRGSNLEALLQATSQPDFPAAIVLVGCNRVDAPAIARAEAHGVPVTLADRSVLKKRHERQTLLLEALKGAQVELVVLAGFDEILIDEFVETYALRIVNTHPSLLPAFGQTMHAVQQALEHGVKVTGCTLHLVTNDLDAGPILLQQCVEVRDDEDVESLHARIRAAEHRLLPLAVRAFAEGRVRIEGKRARVLRSIN